MFQAIVLRAGQVCGRAEQHVRGEDAAVAEAQPATPRNGSLAIQGNAMNW
jgi:hypothetical protein